jgi:hypothetical protein
MLRIDTKDKRLVRLTPANLAEAEYGERMLQQMIIASPGEFCEEIGEPLWLIGQEVKPSDSIADRVDILAIDDSGNSVIIELKRGAHKMQLLQAVSYSGMIARWPAERFVATLAANYNQSLDEATADIEEHIRDELATINRSQRIILMAEDFDPALLFGAEWLNEQHGVDIRCYRMELAREDGRDLLTCTCIYPPLEIAAVTRGGASPGEAPWPDWPTALEDLDNPAMAKFFLGETEAHQKSSLRYRALYYDFAGKRRFSVECRQRFAYVWQHSRFDGDIDFWRSRLSAPDMVTEVARGKALRFRLISADDFPAFSTAMKSDMPTKQFCEPSELQRPPVSAL